MGFGELLRLQTGDRAEPGGPGEDGASREHG